MSRFKPGQLVTIDHTVYRIRKADITLFMPCSKCAAPNVPFSVLRMCTKCLAELGLLGYYETVTGKRVSKV